MAATEQRRRLRLRLVGLLHQLAVVSGAAMTAAANALATMAQYQIFFTCLLAFLLLDEPFDLDYTAISWLLVIAVCGVLGYTILRGLREAQARFELQALNEEVKELSVCGLNKALLLSFLRIYSHHYSDKPLYLRCHAFSITILLTIGGAR